MWDVVDLKKNLAAANRSTSLSLAVRHINIEILCKLVNFSNFFLKIYRHHTAMDISVTKKQSDISELN